MSVAKPITQAIILAGGTGSRLGGLTEQTPKPLLPIAGRPFIDYVISTLAQYGIEDIILSTGYLAHAFDEFIEGRTWRGPYGNSICVRTLKESAPAGTAGALKLHQGELSDRFLLLNGDSFFDCDWAALMAAGELLPPGQGLLTVREVQDAQRYGRVGLDGDRVVAFDEKAIAGAGPINAGITVLTRDCVSLISELPCSLEKDVYPKLVSAGLLKGLVQSGYFIDIGLPETYSRAQTEMPKALRKPALFLDRDGVLNKNTGYVHRAEDFEWLPGAIDAIRLARKAGMLIIVVTNQAGVARGFYEESAIERLHRHINRELRSHGTWIDAFYYCPYHTEGTVAEYRRISPDRKPGSGMLFRAFADFSIDKERSFLVGDNESDMQAAVGAGIPGYLAEQGSLFRVISSAISRHVAATTG